MTTDYRHGEEVILREKQPSAAAAFRLLASLPEDFMSEGRQDDPPQYREGLRVENRVTPEIPAGGPEV